MGKQSVERVPAQRLLGKPTERYNAQYPPLIVSEFSNAHDRFFCIDETVYHIGASLKDLGKKWFAFSKMEVKTRMLIKKMKNI